jgi:hypothetical protein
MPGRFTLSAFKRPALLLGVVVILLVMGLWLRKWTYLHTGMMRHDYDVKHNYLWGKRALDEGVLNLYGNIIGEHPEGDYGLDYPPLRLVVMRDWAAWVQSNYGDVGQWREEYAFTAPILWVNTGAELATAVMVFLLIRKWRGKEAVWAAVIGAGLVWLSPASMLSAHGWPSSDVWVAPFYLLGILLAGSDWWFAAGVVVGIGTMFKGQELLVAPVFVLWPVMMKRVEAAGRWVAGFLLAATVIVAPWLLRDAWTHGLMFGAMAWVGVAAVIAVAACAWARRGWWIVGGVVGVALATCPLVFRSDLSWWRTAFAYGAEKFPSLSLTTLNLATLLGMRFGVESLQSPVWTGPFVITVKPVLVGVYAMGLVAAAAAMGKQSRRRDARFLVAVAAPWVWCVAVMPSMHSRYLLFASTMGAVAAGMGVGMIVLDLFLIGAAWIGVAHLLPHTQMGIVRGLPSGFGAYLPGRWAAVTREVIDGCVPDLAWGILVCALVYLGVALWSKRGRRLSYPTANARCD